MPADPALADLVTRAKHSDQQAWSALVERYAPLLWSICRSYQLTGPDTADVSQDVWLTLASRLGTLREPDALPGWLATTTRRQCARARRAMTRSQTALPTPGIEKHPRPLSRDHRAATANRRTAHRAAPGRCQPAPRPPAADHPARRRPPGPLHRDQRRAGHRGRQHRAHPRPLPGQATPPSSSRRPDRRARPNART
jgi:RNA polymerase sigma factor (sigma-70 family)